MAFAKLPIAGQEPAKIRFFYTIDEIFDDVTMMTTYRSKMVKDDTGKSLLNEVAVSMDEKDIVKRTIDVAIGLVGNEVFKLAQGVANSIFHDTRLSGDVLEKNSTGFEVLDHAKYNGNLLTVLDKQIKKCIIEYCLAEWYKVVGLGNDFVSYFTAYEKSLVTVANLTFQLRKSAS